MNKKIISFQSLMKSIKIYIERLDKFYV